MKLSNLFESTEYTIDDAPIAVRSAGPNGTTKLHMELSKREFEQLNPEPVYGDDGSKYDSPAEWLQAIMKRGTKVVWMDRFQANRRAKDMDKLRHEFIQKGWDSPANAAALQHQVWRRRARANET